jgi:hypothetical protein
MEAGSTKYPTGGSSARSDFEKKWNRRPVGNLSEKPEAVREKAL